MREQSIPSAEVYATALCEYLQAMHASSFFTRIARHTPEQTGRPYTETSVCLFQNQFGIFSKYIGLVRIVEDHKAQKKNLSIRIAKSFLSQQELEEIARDTRATDNPTI